MAYLTGDGYIITKEAGMLTWNGDVISGAAAMSLLERVVILDKEFTKSTGVESDGKVVRVQDKGVVVDLGDDIEGFVPASHSGVDDPNQLELYYDAGDPVSLRVIESDATNRRVVLEVTSTPERKPNKPPKPEPTEGEEVGVAAGAEPDAGVAAGGEAAES